MYQLQRKTISWLKWFGKIKKVKLNTSKLDKRIECCPIFMTRCLMLVAVGIVRILKRKAPIIIVLRLNIQTMNLKGQRRSLSRQMKSLKLHLWRRYIIQMLIRIDAILKLTIFIKPLPTIFNLTKVRLQLFEVSIK